MATLIKPPQDDPQKSLMENNMELRNLDIITPDLFTNLKPLWHPPGARGIYGGAVIAQCLAAAYRTVPEDFSIHSMHCYFVLNGNAEIPVIYHVERVREGRSYATRTVQARQRGKAIFTVTLSFQRENSAGDKLVEHQTPLPDVPPPAEDDSDTLHITQGPFRSQTWEAFPEDGPAHQKRTKMWLKARGRISDEGGHRAHCTALAYMSDSYFIGTVARVHKLWRNLPPSRADAKDYDKGEKKAELGMMVSLDHTIYFHQPRSFRADEWLYSEMQSPWSGDGRGLVMQRIWTKDGKLVASCIQEGLVRLKQDGAGSKL